MQRVLFSDGDFSNGHVELKYGCKRVFRQSGTDAQDAEGVFPYPFGEGFD